jgi:hypothetical protein
MSDTVVKLIFCPNCSDVVRLIEVKRYCFCARAYGQYLQDGLNAEIGGIAVPLGFANPSFKHALENQPEEGAGFVFEAFVIPKKCDTITKV